jgi:hypothetical protein
VTLANVDFSTLRAQPLRPAAGQPTFLIACRPYGQMLHADPRRLRLVLHAPNVAGGGDDVYRVVVP